MISALNLPFQKLRYLQHIGKIDRPPEVVIFLHICNIAIFVFLSIYMHSADI